MRTNTEKYCFNCGEAIDAKSIVCPKCGVQQPSFQKNESFSTEWLVTLILCALFGVWGIHRFYNGRITSGVFQLLTFGGLGIWSLVDLIMIVVGQFKDKNGNPIVMRTKEKENPYCC